MQIVGTSLNHHLVAGREQHVMTAHVAGNVCRNLDPISEGDDAVQITRDAAHDAALAMQIITHGMAQRARAASR